MRLACMPRTGNYTISSCVARRKGRQQHMDRISLWYCEGASDKIYEAEIVPVSDGFQSELCIRPPWWHDEHRHQDQQTCALRPGQEDLRHARPQIGRASCRERV